jgi:Zn-dependent protease with chaperone function
MLKRFLLYGSVAGFGWLTLLTLYYAAIRKRRAVLSMFASFVIAAMVTVWTAAAFVAASGLTYYFFNYPEMSWDTIFTIVVAAYVVSVVELTVFFVVNQWSVRRLVGRYRTLADEELTNRLRNRVDVDSLAEEFEIGYVEVLVVDDTEANAHTMAVARPSLFSPKLGSEVLVIKRPLVEELDDDELKTVLAHEFGHIEGLDARFRPYFEVLARVYRFDPVIRSLRSWVRRIQEYGADDRAVEVTGNPQALARALVKVTEHISVGDGRTFEVKERAERLADMEKDR